MSPAQRAAVLAAALCTGAATGTAACELVLSEHRGTRELQRLPLGSPPVFTVAFEHSVLGSTVTDTYRVLPDGRTLLVEERFRGDGYGLPHAAGPGERLQRDGADGWRLTLERLVDPLVLRALPAQRLRVAAAGGPPLLLATLPAAAVDVQTAGCALP